MRLVSFICRLYAANFWFWYVWTREGVGEGGENPDPSNLIIKQNLIFNYLIFRRFFSIIVCRFVVLISLAIHDASVTRYA
jgi:hypothetical protein